jgi:ABC-type multidrug transport system fused ATPase/permease subunit
LSEQKQEKWITWLALTTAAMAVFAAITTLYMGKYSSRAILFQGQETNQWGYYQAKSIKGYLYETQLERLRLERLGDEQNKKSEASEKREKTIIHYTETIQRYEKEKAEIKAKADDFAKQKVIAQDKAGNFGYALIFLQAAIMLSSVAVITKKKPLWYFGMTMVSGWAFFFLDAIFLFR